MTTTPKTILMIVESPQKATKIQSLLSGGPERYVVAATYGHIADIPEGDDTAVDRANGYEPRYELTEGGRKVVADLQDLLTGVDAVVLATDGDREGEVIAQHVIDFVIAPVRPDLLQELPRATFDAIAESSIRAALAEPRQVDSDLVEAAKARRVVDRLFGYGVTELAWQKVNRAASGGRTQSPALRMVIERERERMAFVPAEYWTVEAVLDGVDGAAARAVRFDGRPLVTGAAHLDGSAPIDGRAVLDEEAANRLAAGARQLTVTIREERPVTRRPKPPYNWSALLRDANTRLSMSVAQTTAIGEALRNAGLVTYLRTDSTHFSDETRDAIRAHVAATFGRDHLGDGAAPDAKPGALVQGAHEAVHPVDITVEVAEGFDDRARALYAMIRARTLASQMAPARGRTTTVTLDGGGAEFRVSSTVIDVPGFLRALPDGDGAAEPAADLAGLMVGAVVDVGCTVTSHETQPPARYTEASLIEALEERGIGRPSTYGDVVAKLRDRFVWQQGGARGALVPRLSAFAMARMLEVHFAEWVDDGYTARLEKSLDGVAAGTTSRTSVVTAFMEGDGTARGFAAAVESARRSDDHVYDLATLGPHPETGEDVVLKSGRAFGKPPIARPYVASGGRTAPVPDDTELGAVTLDYAIGRLAPQNRELGVDPESGKSVWLRNGAHGPYVQLGGDPGVGQSRRKKSEVAAPKPLTASLPEDADSSAIGLDDALRLIRAAHRRLGAHPDTGEIVWISTSNRFGKPSSFVRCGAETRTVKGDPDAVNLEAALALLAVPKPERRGRRPRKR